MSTKLSKHLIEESFESKEMENAEKDHNWEYKMHVKFSGSKNSSDKIKAILK